MKALMPPLGDLEHAIEQELQALESSKTLAVRTDTHLPLDRQEIASFVSSFSRDLPPDALEEEHVRSTAERLVHSFLDRFGSELVERQGFPGFKKALVPILREIVAHLAKE